MVSFICPRGQVKENRTLKLKSSLMNIKSSKRLPRYMNWCVQLFFVHFRCYFHCVFIITCASHCNGVHNNFFFVYPRGVDMCLLSLILLPAMKNLGKLIVAGYLRAKSLRPNCTKTGDFPGHSLNLLQKQFTSHHLIGQKVLAIQRQSDETPLGIGW